MQVKHTATWYHRTPVTVVPQQDSVGCQSSKTAQKQCEEHDKELKVFTWPSKCPGCESNQAIWTCLKTDELLA